MHSVYFESLSYFLVSYFEMLCQYFAQLQIITNVKRNNLISLLLLQLVNLNKVFLVNTPPKFILNHSSKFLKHPIPNCSTAFESRLPSTQSSKVALRSMNTTKPISYICINERALSFPLFVWFIKH